MPLAKCPDCEHTYIVAAENIPFRPCRRCQRLLDPLDAEETAAAVALVCAGRDHLREGESLNDGRA
jgi:hypothetical protein